MMVAEDWSGTDHSTAIVKNNLSARELDCLRLVADGRTSSDISATLAISESTVNHHLAAASRKLMALNRTHAVATAFRLKLLE